ncbi:MAG TPA: hypothetical protein VFG06_06365 [Thermodesulfovibrionales bacterium]|jgi:hypothetical protein|nr:hypothetical protein [Thermodesulfovibrionales bacterium]
MKQAVFINGTKETKDDMERAIPEQIEEMIDGLQCPKEFSCYTSNFKNLCKAKDIGLESFVVCLMSDPFACKFSLLFGSVFFCQCKLRVYIAKKLTK